MAVTLTQLTAFLAVSGNVTLDACPEATVTLTAPSAAWVTLARFDASSVTFSALACECWHRPFRAARRPPVWRWLIARVT
jgi:hypothetical protein